METLSPTRRAEALPSRTAPVPLAARTEAAVEVDNKGGIEIRALDGVSVGPVLALTVVPLAVILGLAGVVAAMRPARWAARMDVLAAVAAA